MQKQLKIIGMLVTVIAMLFINTGVLSYANGTTKTYKISEITIKRFPFKNKYLQTGNNT